MTAVAAPWTLAEGFAIPSKCSKLHPCTARFRSAKACMSVLPPPSRLWTAYLELTQRCRRRARQHTPARDTVGHTAKAPTKCFPQASRNNVGAGAARGSPDRAGSRLPLRSDDSAHSARFQPLSRRVCVCARALCFLGAERAQQWTGWRCLPIRQQGPASTSWNQPRQKLLVSWGERVDRSLGPESGTRGCAGGSQSLTDCDTMTALTPCGRPWALLE